MPVSLLGSAYAGSSRGGARLAVGLGSRWGSAYAGVRLAARLRARWAATCERVAQRSEQNRRQLFDDVSR
ncbi:hypothetical protein Acsp02_26970 [Actinoplanes sp. NBRC 103695]|nr:hypothetical protein Acsp02_26970 [Actinoplanes sp. NBRC 103695]